VLNELARTRKAATAGIMTYVMIWCQFLLEDPRKMIKVFHQYSGHLSKIQTMDLQNTDGVLSTAA
jgi:hypothetical protein